MVNRTRDFRPALLEELKHFNHCTKKSKDPSHFCNQPELAKNLRMSLRDVGKTLHEMTAEGLVKHDKSKQNGRLQDRFIPTNDRLYESKEMILEVENIINNKIEIIRKIAVKMRDRPAIKSINMIPVLKDPNNPQEVARARNYTGKIDKIGHNHLDQFCENVNHVFSYIDSLTYATYDDSIEANDMTDKVITNLKINFCNELTDILKHIFKNQSVRKAQHQMEMIQMKIPLYHMLMQLQRKAKFKI